MVVLRVEVWHAAVCQAGSQATWSCQPHTVWKTPKPECLLACAGMCQSECSANHQTSRCWKSSVFQSALPHPDAVSASTAWVHQDGELPSRHSSRPYSWVSLVENGCCCSPRGSKRGNAPCSIWLPQNSLVNHHFHLFSLLKMPQILRHAGGFLK